MEWAIAPIRRGGKSELQRTECRVTPGCYSNNGIATESATENIPSRNFGIRVKWQGKSLPLSQ